MVFRHHGCVAKSSTKVTTLPPVSRLALTPKSSFSLARLFFNGLLRLARDLAEDKITTTSIGKNNCGAQLRLRQIRERKSDEY